MNRCIKRETAIYHSALKPLFKSGLFTSLADLVYPRYCAGCGIAVSGEPSHLCWDCRATIEIIQEPFCTVCGDPAEGMVEHKYTCSLCRRDRRYFDRARSAVRFRGVVKDIMHEFKYNKATYLARDLIPFLRACIETHYSDVDFDAVAFVPLYPKKERDRTYNQAHLLAIGAAKYAGLPLLRSVLHRARDTKTQTDLSTRERKKNVHSAFEAYDKRWIEGRRFLLVDDVMTTGATVNEVSRVLKKAGAAGVYVATVARG